MKKTLIMAGAVLMLAACSNKEKEYDATGTFEATEVTVSAKSSGELKLFDVKEGEQVANGTVVGRIEAYQLQLKRNSSRQAADSSKPTSDNSPRRRMPTTTANLTWRSRWHPYDSRLPTRSASDSDSPNW